MKLHENFLYTITMVVFFGSLSLSSVNAQVKFEDITKSANIESPSGSPSYNSMWIDLDNDDFLDLYIARGNQSTHQNTQIYLNKKNGTFQNITSIAFPNRTPAYNGHICWGDYDNDGLIDLYEGHFDGTDNRLWHHNLDHSFSDNSSELINTGQYSTGCVWSDFDGDGFIDLFINTQAGLGSFCERSVKGNAFVDYFLFENPGQGHLLLSVDIDGDDLPDYYLGNIHTLDYCYVSKNGSYHPMDNSFLDSHKAIHQFQSGAFADIDNDGYPDLLYVQNNVRYLLHNDLGLGFSDWSGKMGLLTTSTAEQRTTFIQDLDNDGFLDILIQRIDDSSEVWYGGLNGFRREILPFPVTNEHESEFSWTDFDNDGFIDLLHVTPSKTTFWRNTGNQNSWINVTLKGKKANRSGIGTKVFAYNHGNFQLREVGYNQGTLGYSPLLAHFGFGPSDCTSGSVIDSLVVIWQPGGRQVIRNVRMNELVVVDQDSGIVRTIQRPISGGSGWAQNRQIYTTTVRADSIVEVPFTASVVSSTQFRIDSAQVKELSFQIRYNSNVIDVTPSKVAQRYIAPQGWTFKKAIVTTDTITISITNTAQKKLSGNLDLGSLRFDTYWADPHSTLIQLNSIDLVTSDGTYHFCSSQESDFLAHIYVGSATDVKTNLSSVERKLVVSSDPVRDNILKLELKNENSKADILIYDCLGRKLMDQETQFVDGTLRANLNGLSAGVYYVHVLVGKQNYIASFRKLE